MSFESFIESARDAWMDMKEAYAEQVVNDGLCEFVETHNISSHGRDFIHSEEDTEYLVEFLTPEMKARVMEWGDLVSKSLLKRCWSSCPLKIEAFCIWATVTGQQLVTMEGL